MALTRKLLKGIGLTDEQIENIIEAHTDTVKAKDDQISALTKQVSDLEAAAKTAADEKAELQKAFDGYKAEVTGREQAAKVKAAYKQLLEAAHIDADYHDVILEATKLDGLKLDKDGGIEGADKLTEGIKARWGKFAVETGRKKADVPQPPKGGDPAAAFEAMTLTDKMAYANQHPGDANVRAWLDKK